MSKSKVAPSEQLSMVTDPHRHLSHFRAEGRACPEGPRGRSPRSSPVAPGSAAAHNACWIKCRAARWASRPNSSAPFTSSPPPDSNCSISKAGGTRSNSERRSSRNSSSMSMTGGSRLPVPDYLR